MKVTEKFVYFWGKEDIFSQWHNRGFSDKDIHFKTAEHYMMFQKAVFFEYKKKSIDEIKAIIEKARQLQNETGKRSRNILVRILDAETPKKAKELGRDVRFFNKEKWEAVVKKILIKGNSLKFEQNEDLLKVFLSFKTQRFVEASPFDRIYGIGMRDSDPRASDPARWLGENILGDAFTELRDMLLPKYPQY